MELKKLNRSYYYDVQFVQAVTNMSLMISKENKGNQFTGPGPQQTTKYKGHDLNIASLALSKLPFGILTFSQFSLKVMQNGSKDVCCLSGSGQLQTDRELSTPNCHTAQVPGLCHHSLLNFWERQIWLFGKDAIWQSLSQIVLLLSEFNSLGLSKFIQVFEF